jgi:hypothetical protein
VANEKIVHIDLDTGEMILKSQGAINSNFVVKAGDTMTGFLFLSGDPTQPLHAATKQYVDGLIGGGPFLPTAGGTMLGHIVLPGNPTLALQAAPKQYVDSAISDKGFTFTQVVAATTWTVIHNKNTTNLIAQVYIGNEQTIPDALTIIDSNTITVQFGAAVAGKVNIYFWTP